MLTKDGLLALKTEGFQAAQAALKALGQDLAKAEASTMRLGQRALMTASNFAALQVYAKQGAAWSVSAIAATQRAGMELQRQMLGSFQQVLGRMASTADAGAKLAGSTFARVADQAQAAGQKIGAGLMSGLSGARASAGRAAGGGGSDGIGAIAGKLASSIGSAFKAISVGVAAGAGAGFGLFKLLEQGDKVRSVAAGFEVLARQAGGAQAVLAGLTRTTGGAVSQQELMVAANRLFSAQLGFSRERMEKLAGAGITLGRALGFTASEAVDRLSLALAKQEPELLDELGIKVDLVKAIGDYAKAHGVAKDSIDAQTRTRIFADAVEAQALKRAKELQAATGAQVPPSELLAAKWKDMTDRLTATIAAAPGLVDSLGSMAEGAIRLATALTPIVNMLASIAGWIARYPALAGLLAGGAAGAVAGSAFGPLGTAIGAGVGALGGAVLGLTAPAAESSGAKPQPIEVRLTQRVELGKGGIETAAAEAGRNLKHEMHRAVGGVRSGLERGISRGFTEAGGANSLLDA